MSVVDAGDGPMRARGEHRAGTNQGTRLTLLGIDKLVENLSAILASAGTRTIRTVVPNRAVRLVVNREEMDKAFAMLVTLVARSSAVTILGGLVPIKAGEEYEGKGCALLSISARPEQSVESGPSGDALAALGGIIKKHNGSFRLGTGRGEMRFNLYLPVVGEHEETDKLTNRLRCPQCGTSFRVELDRMRLKTLNPCPSCGFQCGISKHQAIRAHRLLERLEYRKRIVSPAPQPWTAKSQQ